MAIKGSLREASLPDVLQLLAMGQKTGCLSVTDRANFGSIYFDRGRIVYASIVNRRDRLGDLLVKNGLVEPPVLAAAIEAQAATPDRRVGQLLVERGAISVQQLEQYIRLQIEEAVYYLFTWTQGSFYFEADQAPDAGAMRVSINPENLLLEGARRIDEWSVIEQRITSLDLLYRLDREAGELAGTEISEEQRKILPLLDGRHTVHEIVEESGLVEFDVGKAIFGLLQAGIVREVGERRPVVVTHVPAARIDEHRNLGVAFYRTAMYDEAVREFRRVVELQPGNLEARFYLGLTALRQGDDRAALRQFREVVQAGGARAAVFHDLALALERLGLLDDARLALEEALRLAPQRAATALSHAIVLLKLGAVADAVAAFARYRELLGTGRAPAIYYVFCTLADAAAGDLEAAAACGEEGLQHHPHAAPLLLHLGALRER
jgi:tetratricopeptide (TPR) repeat protein